MSAALISLLIGSAWWFGEREEVSDVVMASLSHQEKTIGQEVMGFG